MARMFSFAIIFDAGVSEVEYKTVGTTNILVDKSRIKNVIVSNESIITDPIFIHISLCPDTIIGKTFISMICGPPTLNSNICSFPIITGDLKSFTAKLYNKDGTAQRTSTGKISLLFNIIQE